MTGRSAPNDRANMTGKVESNVTRHDTYRTLGDQSPPGRGVARLVLPVARPRRASFLVAAM